MSDDDSFLVETSEQPRVPPFLFTYWNPFSKDSHLLSSWFDYVKDVTVARYAADSIGRYVQEASAEQIHAVNTVGRAICGEISGLSNQVGRIAESVREVAQSVDRVGRLVEGVNLRLDLALDATRTSNILLGNIADLLKIPDSHKQRQHHVEMGLKFLQQALKDNDLYQDALHELLESEKLMPYDYFVLHRIGMIYLYVPALGDLDKALDYFTRAAKYAAVDTSPNAVRLNNILNKRVDRKFAEQPQASSADVGELAAESYLQAATALYATGQFPQAVTMAEKAVQYNANEAKYWFFLAKYLSRIGQADAAVPKLEKAVHLAPEMALASIGDFDLNNSPVILNLLSRLNSEIETEINGHIEGINKWMTTYGNFQQALESIREAEATRHSGNYSDKVSVIKKLQSLEELLPSLYSLKIIESYGISFNRELALKLLHQNDPDYVISIYREKYPTFALDKLIEDEPIMKALMSQRPEETYLGQTLLVTSDYLIRLNEKSAEEIRKQVTGERVIEIISDTWKIPESRLALSARYDAEPLKLYNDPTRWLNLSEAFVNEFGIKREWANLYHQLCTHTVTLTGYIGGGRIPCQ